MWLGHVVDVCLGIWEEKRPQKTLLYGRYRGSTRSTFDFSWAYPFGFLIRYTVQEILLRAGGLAHIPRVLSISVMHVV